MAFGVIGLSCKGRYIYTLILFTLIALQSILGFITLLWAIYICRSVSPRLITEQVEVSFLFLVIGIFGSHIFFHGLVGFNVCHKCFKQAQKSVCEILKANLVTLSTLYFRKSTRRALFVWILIGCNVILNVYIIASRTAVVSKHVIDALTRSLKNGMEYYLKDPFWKFTIDSIQTNLQCCGLYDYKSWYNTIWLDENQLQMNTPLIQELRLSQTKPHFPITPWSCCKVDYPLQCFHDPFQQSESSYLWKEEPLFIEQSIYTVGCLPILYRPLQQASKAIIYIICFTFFVMIFSIIIARIVYTSCRNNIILQHPSGIAPGWIFGRGDCGFAWGPTLDQIMIKILSKYSGTDEKKASTKSKSSVKTREKKFDKLWDFSKMIHEKKKDNSKKVIKIYRSEEDPVSSEEEKALML